MLLLTLLKRYLFLHSGACIDSSGTTPVRLAVGFGESANDVLLTTCGDAKRLPWAAPTP